MDGHPAEDRAVKLLIAAAVGLAAGYLFRRHIEPAWSFDSAACFPSVWGETHTDDFPQWTWTVTDTPAT